ncbi:MAG: A/G-specific adenine glycosylase, partial [Burkholderiales bacterium]
MSEFSQLLIRWQRTHGRHHLPWQNTRDAYRIWLSEIMLQQTQVSSVIPYYQRFLQRFPTVIDLANADLEQVMPLWSGLGYYTRARNLHACARAVVENHNGVFPADVQQLISLPGIGR